VWRNSINSDLFSSLRLARAHPRHLARHHHPLPGRSSLVCVCGLIRNQWAELRRKKKVLLFLNTLKVARWFILFLSSTLRFIDCITISTVFFLWTFGKSACPKVFCYETEIKSPKIASTFRRNNITYHIH